MDLLTGKRIVILGGTTGIGLSAAKAFISNGARLVLVGRNPENVTAAQDLLGDEALAICGDARDASIAEQAIESCVQIYGGFDGLYHVAGGSGRKMGDGPLHEMSMEGWNLTMELNLTSLMLSNRAAIRKFLEQQKGGVILNMSSVLGFSPSPKYFATHAYAAAKAAIIGFSKSIASYYAKNNIRINTILPALVETPMAKRAAADQEILSYINTKQPLDGGRIGRAEDLDGLAIYLMSDQAIFTSGQAICVDGGWSMSDGQY
jgi:NAD(P)-dependent dehydrogenase (short-subunit alcohol dehydrogenase family)